MFWRHFRKNKAYSLINLFGLTLGLSVSVFILLFVQDELSYDRFLAGYEQVIRIQPASDTGDGMQEWSTTEGFLLPTLAPMYPEIQSSTRILRNDNEVVFSSETEKYGQDGVIAADSTFFEVFPFPFIYGQAESALNKPDGIVITLDVARKFFGNNDPVGKILRTDFGTFTVNGVVADVPPASHFHFKVVFPLKSWWREADQSRNAFAFYSYLKLQSKEKAMEFGNNVLKDWYNHYANVPVGEPPLYLLAMPLADIHLQSHAEKEFEANGQWQVVYVFIAVAVLLMVIATINYINLSNAMAIRRAREVAVRKTIGASRQRLFFNFMLESYGFSSAGFALALVVVAILLPQFNTFTGKSIHFQALLNMQFVSTVFVAWIVLGFLSGLYPATLLASFSPVQALKSNVAGAGASKLSRYFRQGLIVSQFTISALMIVSAFTVRQQLNFIEHRNVGFNKKNVVTMQLTGDARRKMEVLKNEIGKLKSVTSCTATSATPGKRVMILIVRVPDLAGTRTGTPAGDDGTREMRVISADHDFVKTMGLTIVEGRDFSIENASDTAEAFIVNEAAVKSFHLKDPVGRPFEYVYNASKIGKIIGVVRDFNFASVHNPVEPVMIHFMRPFYSTMCVRLNSPNVKESLEEIDSTWKSVTSVPFSYQFLDTTYDALYRTERTTGSVITLFTALALVIAGLGLFGIVSFFAAQRLKEVGVRKVFGATHASLVGLLSREYVLMVVVGNIVALYPGYWLITQWLQQFAYRIDLSFSTFLTAFLLSEILAFASIIFVVQKTAKVNPAAILRHE